MGRERRAMKGIVLSVFVRVIYACLSRGALQRAKQDRHLVGGNFINHSSGLPRALPRRVRTFPHELAEIFREIRAHEDDRQL